MSAPLLSAAERQISEERLLRLARAEAEQVHERARLYGRGGAELKKGGESDSG